jgi:hypothetical protein
LSAISKALEWWLKSKLRGASPLIIVADSLWAVGVAKGGRSKYHKIAAWAVQDVVKNEEVEFGWIKSHSGHEWNDKADELANRGRAMGPERARRSGPGPVGQKKVKKSSRSGAVESARYTWVVGEEELRGTGLAMAGRIKKATVGRDQEGRRVVETIYVRKSRFGRRNATGASLQFMSKAERSALVGEVYAEVDMRSAHPTVLWWAAKRYGGEGMGLRRLGQLARSSESVVAEVSREYEARLGVQSVERASVKRILLAAINGGSVERMARESLGGWVAGGVLDQFKREVELVRAKVMQGRPDIAEDVRRRNPGIPEWKLRVKATYFLMTEGEDAALRIMEDVAKECGLQGDAPTGDGLLVRRGDGGIEKSVEEVVGRMQEQIQRRIGIPMQVGIKSVGGERVSSWPWQAGRG